MSAKSFNLLAGAGFFFIGLALLEPLGLSPKSSIPKIGNARIYSMPEDKVSAALSMPCPPMATGLLDPTESVSSHSLDNVRGVDPLWDFWLFDYDGGLTFEQFEEALRPTLRGTPGRNEIGEITKARRIAAGDTNIRCSITAPLTPSQSPYIAALELRTHTASPDLELIYQFRNKTCAHRSTDWHDNFSDETVFKPLLQASMLMLMKSLAEKGIWV